MSWKYGTVPGISDGLGGNYIYRSIFPLYYEGYNKRTIIHPHFIEKATQPHRPFATFFSRENCISTGQCPAPCGPGHYPVPARSWHPRYKLATTQSRPQPDIKCLGSAKASSPAKTTTNIGRTRNSYPFLLVAHRQKTTL